ncbi:sugar phosphate isomerase/epimerase [Mesorhizobium sp. CGMCC 1.15528]|uniref:Sugar phosphate isomerase/epimerase n=1 Tax=Mesorhizobium zhangyense TaxID=1776730 RepID=A0A7C9V8G7_9HYPH|nr:TIM barrel protein [Mesorhizobium zhangyense]NGN43004.1 sugar phosphate isomerase/epimerase [Mesorhizobium zhangyense]
MIAGAAGAGLDAVGLRIIAPRPGDVVAPVSGNPLAIRELKDELGARNIRLNDIEAIIIREDTDFAVFEPALAAGVELGAAHVIANMYVEEPVQAAEQYAKLCELAARHELCVALEFIPLSLLKTLDQALNILKLADQPNGRLLIDAIHLSRSGGHPRDLAGVDPKLFAFAHFCDAPLKQPSLENLPLETRQQRMLPGEGELWLPEFVAALPGNLTLGIETPSLATAGLPVAEKIARGAAAMRRVLERCGEKSA